MIGLDSDPNERVFGIKVRLRLQRGKLADPFDVTARRLANKRQDLSKFTFFSRDRCAAEATQLSREWIST